LSETVVFLRLVCAKSNFTAAPVQATGISFYWPVVSAYRCIYLDAGRALTAP
jgi:hypothetical protein